MATAIRVLLVHLSPDFVNVIPHRLPPMCVKKDGPAPNLSRRV
jgi:hypothetical protein